MTRADGIPAVARGDQRHAASLGLPRLRGRVGAWGEGLVAHLERCGGGHACVERIGQALEEASVYPWWSRDTSAGSDRGALGKAVGLAGVRVLDHDEVQVRPL